MERGKVTSHEFKIDPRDIVLIEDTNIALKAVIEANKLGLKGHKILQVGLVTAAFGTKTFVFHTEDAVKHEIETLESRKAEIQSEIDELKAKLESKPEGLSSEG